MANYHFSASSGNDTTGDGSEGNPWQNFSRQLNSSGAIAAPASCLFLDNDIWLGSNAIVSVASNGSNGADIVLSRYGSGGAKPVLCGCVTAVGWTVHSGPIYRKTAMFTTMHTVGVDGSTALCTSLNNNSSLLAGQFLNQAGTLFIRLFDDSDPAGHTIYVPNYMIAADNFAGLFDLNGQYVKVDGLQSWYSPGYGVYARNRDCRVSSSRVIGSGKDGVITGLAAAIFRMTTSEVLYCCAAGPGVGGQSVTLTTSNGWIKKNHIHDGFTEGIDFLDWSEAGLSNPTQCGAVWNLLENNGRAQPGLSAPAIYNDGANNTFIYGNVMNGNGLTPGSTADCPGVAVGTEHALNHGNNVWVINNLISGFSRWGVFMETGDGADTISQVFVINNTVIGNQNNTRNEFSDAITTRDIASTAGTVVIRNNVFISASNTNSRINNSVNTSSAISSNYNSYYRALTNILFQTDFGNPTYTLASWQSASGEDLASTGIDPLLVLLNESSPNAKLTAASTCISLGTANAFVIPNWIPADIFEYGSGEVRGIARSDGTVDLLGIDAGYHYDSDKSLVAASSGLNFGKLSFTATKVSINRDAKLIMAVI